MRRMGEKTVMGRTRRQKRLPEISKGVAQSSSLAEVYCVHNMSFFHAGTSVLKGVDDYMSLLDEHITMTQAMTFSTFKGPFEEKIEKWNSTLQVLLPSCSSSSLVDIWSAVCLCEDSPAGKFGNCFENQAWSISHSPKCCVRALRGAS